VPRRPGIDDDGPAWAELHVVDRAGKSRPFVTGKVNVGSVAWTPDGRGIAFLAKREGDDHRSLYVIPVDGGEARKGLEAKADIADFSLSPDGEDVAYLAEEEPPKDLEEARKKGFNQQVVDEDWRPTRVWIAEIEDDADDDEDEEDADDEDDDEDEDEDEDDDEPRALELDGSASAVHWSPDGGKLAVVVAPTPLVDDSYTRRKVRVLDAESGAVVAQYDTPGKLGAVAWSPDGEHLAFISAEDANDPAEGRLMVAAANADDFRDLLPGYEGHVAAIAWRDADTVAFLGDEGVWTTWNHVDLDGARQTLIPASQAVLTAVSLSKDGGQAAFLGESPEHPAEVLTGSADGAEPERRTVSNPWLERMRLAAQEVVSYKARDGLELEGILIRPLVTPEGNERRPLILAVHGGPEAHVRNGWLTSYANPGQVAAAKGMAVFYPNYRGSTGRGVAFSKLGQADAAGKEFDDLADAVDHFVEAGLADPKKVGITGGSYGGYASAWGATYYTEKFAASVMFVGISDKIAKTGTTDIPEEEFLVHARQRPWDDWQKYLERSPIFHVQKARTPILILHGKDDPRVHPSQSLMLYRFLRAIDQAPVRLVLYPGEGHGNPRAASRLDYSLRMMRWFEHYLSGPGGEPPPYAIDYKAPGEDADDEKAEAEQEPETD